MRKVIIYLLLGLMGINILYVVSGAWHLPIISIDAFGIWLLKTKAWFLEGGLPLGLLRDPLYLRSHPQYPILLPFLFSRIYFLIGEVNERWILMLYPLFYAGCLLLAYQALRRLKFPLLFSLLSTYLYSMFSPLLAQGGREQAGNADIIITLLIWLVVHALITIERQKPSRWPTQIWLVGLIMVASQIKSEGVFLVATLWWLPLSLTRRIQLIFLAVIPTIAWQFYLAQHHIPSDFSLQLFSIGELLIRSATVAAGTIREMLNFRNWYFFWLIFWLAMGWGKTTVPIIRRILTPTLLMMSGGFLAIYLFATIDTWTYVTSSVDRIMLQLSPLWFLLFADRLRSMWRDSGFFDQS